MKGYLDNLEDATKSNNDFLRVLHTAKHSQLAVMSIKVGEEIGEEVHGLDQFIRFEAGMGQVVLDGQQQEVKAEDAVIIPAGTRHNVVNTGNTDLKLYSVYSPPQHRHGSVHVTKADAEAHEEHFDGQTSE
jgi:mannose-6-phosphate isomerase-like protein (cupin superfamily)